MILSFISHSQEEGIHPDKGKYLIMLLESFSNLTINDYGIEPLLGKKAIYQFTTLLNAEYAQQALSEEDYKKICQLCLRVIGNMSVNQEGK